MRLQLTPRNTKSVLLIACLGLPLPILALSADQNQPINIEADTADIDDKAGTTIYRGNVIVTQGSIRLTGDTVTVHSPERSLEKVTAEGKPAHFQQRPENKNEDMRAQSSNMEYLVGEEKLILLGDAHLWQGGDKISGNRIDYDIKADLGKATKGAGGGERVRVIIQPRSKAVTPTVPAGESPAPSNPAPVQP
ncbi:MAG: lipopolysaccharide transport periplasmic protein LptA [Gammaproteobacteria bacterium]